MGLNAHFNRANISVPQRVKAPQKAIAQAHPAPGHVFCAQTIPANGAMTISRVRAARRNPAPGSVIILCAHLLHLILRYGRAATRMIWLSLALQCGHLNPRLEDRARSLKVESLLSGSAGEGIRSQVEIQNDLTTRWLTIQPGSCPGIMSLNDKAIRPP